MNTRKQLKQHFLSQFNKDDVRGPIVSELAPEQEVYYRIGMTGYQQQMISILQRDGKMLESLIQMLCFKALNEDGTRMFTDNYVQDIMSTEGFAEWAIDIVTKITEEEQEGINPEKKF